MIFVSDIMVDAIYMHSSSFYTNPLSFLLNTAGTGGEPSAGVASDPLQYSLQYLALDTVASLGDNATGGWFNYDINPDNPPPDSGTIYQSITATSSITNSISWFQFGGLGMLYFNVSLSKY